MYGGNSRDNAFQLAYFIIDQVVTTKIYPIEWKYMDLELYSYEKASERIWETFSDEALQAMVIYRDYIYNICTEEEYGTFWENSFFKEAEVPMLLVFAMNLEYERGGKPTNCRKRKYKDYLD